MFKDKANLIVTAIWGFNAGLQVGVGNYALAVAMVGVSALYGYQVWTAFNHLKKEQPNGNV